MRNKLMFGLRWLRMIRHLWRDSPMILTWVNVTHENHWLIASYMTKKISFHSERCCMLYAFNLYIYFLWCDIKQTTFCCPFYSAYHAFPDACQCCSRWRTLYSLYLCIHVCWEYLGYYNYVNRTLRFAYIGWDIVKASSALVVKYNSQNWVYYFINCKLPLPGFNFVSNSNVHAASQGNNIGEVNWYFGMVNFIQHQFLLDNLMFMKYIYMNSISKAFSENCHAIGSAPTCDFPCSAQWSACWWVQEEHHGQRWA